MSTRLSGYLPGDSLASQSGLLWRGTHKGEIESLATRKRFKSKWTNDNFPNRPRTYVAGSPQQAQGYAITAAGYQNDRGGLQAARSIFGPNRDLKQTIGDSRIYAVEKSALKRSDEQIRKWVGDYAATAPLKGGIKAKEVRGILKPSEIRVSNTKDTARGRGSSRTAKRDRYFWKPVPLGDIQKKQFSMHEFATITRLRDRIAFVKSLRRQLEKRAMSGDSSHTITGIRAVFAPNTKRYPGMTDKSLPRAVKVDGQPAILHYRGTGLSTQGRLKRPVLETDKWMGKPSSSDVQIVLPRRARPSQWHKSFVGKKTAARPGVHYGNTDVSKAAYYHAHGSEHPTGLISTSVGKKVASNWAVSQGEKAGVLGVYATKARELLRKKRKAAMVSNWTSEREIAQSSGGNLIARRRLKATDRPDGEWDLRRFSRIDRGRVEMSQAIGYEGGVPLTGRIARDRWVKKLRDEDLDRRDANMGRAAAAGAIAGALFPSRKASLYARMGAGAVAGSLGVLGIRQATKNTRDAYGERSRGAKRAEAIPAAAGLTAAGLLGAKKLGLLKKLRMQSAEGRVELEKPFHGYNSKRHAKTGGLNDSFRAKYNREHGSNLKRPVTTEPSKLKPGSKAAKRRKSFCSRMGGMPGPTSKDGKLTPKGAALKRWNCEAKVGSLQFSAGSKKERKLNPYVGAAASGAASGALLGFVPTIMRKGTSLKTAAKAGLGAGALSGAIVGGGALLGSRLIGKPREDEGAAFTKRAAIGGALAGAGAGLAGGVLLRKTRPGARFLVGASKTWRPAEWIRRGPLAGSAAIGAVGGGIYGAATGADEGQQVDSILNLRKDLRKREFAALPKKPAFLIVRGAGRAGEGSVVGKASSLKSARRVRDRHDLKYGAVAHKIVDAQDGKKFLFNRRESRSEAARNYMIGGGVLGAGAGIGYLGYRAGRASRQVGAASEKIGAASQKIGAAAETVDSTVKGVTKPRFVRARQWMKTQLGTFPTFKKVMKKVRFENTARVVELAKLPRYDKLAELRKMGKPTEQLKAVLAKENARQPSWKRGLKNKLRNALDMLALEAIEFADPRAKWEKMNDGINSGLGYMTSAGGGAGAGAVAGRLLGGARKPAMIAGAALGAAAGIGLRKTYGDTITAHRKARSQKENTQPWESWKHGNKAELLNVVPGALGLAGGALLLKASPKILSASNRYGSRFRQWRGRMAAKMPVSKATQDARFAKAKPVKGPLRLMSAIEFQMMRPPMTEEQRRVRNVVIGGATGVVAGTGAAALALRSLRKADERMNAQRHRYVGPTLLPEPTTAKKNLTPTMQDKWAAAQARAQAQTASIAASSNITSAPGPAGYIQPGHKILGKRKMQYIPMTAPQAMARQAEARRIKEVRSIARKPIEDAGAGAKATTKARITQARKLQKIGGVGNAGILSRGERLAASGALAALRKKFRFEHQFDIPVRNSTTGRAAGWKDYIRGESLVDAAGNPTKMSLPTFVRSANRDVQQGWRTVRRGSGLMQDLGEVAQGKKTKKREWEKSWFKNAVATGALTAGALVGGVAYRKGGNFGAPKWAKAWRGGVDYAAGKASSAQRRAQDWLDNKMLEARMDATVRMFDMYSGYYSAPGWDLRDARGKSARVFAPGAQKRVRRQAEWHEKKDNQKKILAAAGVTAALLAGGGGFMLGKQRALRLGKLAKANEKFRAGKNGFGGGPNWN